mgnify:CR=1 FL=1
MSGMSAQTALAMRPKIVARTNSATRTGERRA